MGSNWLLSSGRIAEQPTEVDGKNQLLDQALAAEHDAAGAQLDGSGDAQATPEAQPDEAAELQQNGSIGKRKGNGSWQLAHWQGQGQWQMQEDLMLLHCKKKDDSKYSFTIKADGTLTFHSDGTTSLHELLQ